MGGPSATCARCCLWLHRGLPHTAPPFFQTDKQLLGFGLSTGAWGLPGSLCPALRDWLLRILLPVWPPPAPHWGVRHLKKCQEVEPQGSYCGKVEHSLKIANVGSPHDPAAHSQQQAQGTTRWHPCSTRTQVFTAASPLFLQEVGNLNVHQPTNG